MRIRVCKVGTLASSTVFNSTVETTMVRVGVAIALSKSGFWPGSTSPADPMVISVLPSISPRQHTATQESVAVMLASRAIFSGSGAVPPSASLTNMREFGGAIFNCLSHHRFVLTAGGWIVVTRSSADNRTGDRWRAVTITPSNGPRHFLSGCVRTRGSGTPGGNIAVASHRRFRRHGWKYPCSASRPSDPTARP
jgi:hypothetical protein